jgi:hypothetical protein
MLRVVSVAQHEGTSVLRIRGRAMFTVWPDRIFLVAADSSQRG